MKQSACLLLSSAVSWLLFNPATAAKFAQEDLDDLGPENVKESLSTALILRSSRGAEVVNRSQDQDLDAVVSAKVFDAIAGGFEDLGKRLEKVGLKAGEAAGNAAMVVGDHVVEAAKAHMDSLPWDIKQMADQLGETAKGMADGIKDAGKTLEQGIVELADDALQQAEGLAEQGVFLATEVGTKIGKDIEAAAHAVGDSVKELEKLGPLAMGIAKEAWDEIKKFVNCLDDNGLMCPILIGDRCDCPSGSSVRFDDGELVLKCVVGKSAGFGVGVGFKAKPGLPFGPKKLGKLQLPGEIFEEKKAEVKQAFKPTKGGLKNKMSGAPSGSCETSIDMAIEGHVQNALTFEMSTSGPKSTISISGAIGVSLDGMIKAQGSCKLTAEKRFPKVPKKKIVCYKAFCIIVMVQMVAQLEVSGVLTGTVELGAEVGFDISGSVTLDKTTGKATAEFKAPSVDRQAAFAMGASAFGSVRLGAGPFIVIFPVPGAPVNFNPMLNLELRAQGDIKYGPAGLFLIQEPEASPPSNISLVAESETYQDAVSSKSTSGGSSMLKLCAAAALNIYIDTGITAFGFPVGFDFSFTPRDIIKELMNSMMASGMMAFKALTAVAGCVPGLSQISKVAEKGLQKAAETAANKLTSIIPDLNLNLAGGKPVALAVDKVFCVEAFTTPGFSTSPCARELGCKHVGRLPSSDAEITRILPKKEAMPSVKQWIDKQQLIHELGLGENFIELGNFRLGAIDNDHFSISHCAGNTANTKYEPWQMAGGGVTIEPDWMACQQRCKSVSGCAHFTFWPSGNCRLQSSEATISDDAWSGITGPPSHSQACHTIQIWRADGTNHYGPRTDWGAWRDVHGNLRPRTASGHSVGIHFGFEFIQIGQFRLGAADDTHFSISHSNGNTIEIFRDDGHISSHDVTRKEFGTWDRSVGAPTGISYGDRFLQLGDFRIADEDGLRFVISNVKTKTSIQVFDGSDGRTHPTKKSYTTNFDRAPAHYTVKDIGVTAFGPCDPEFAAFGDRFIQLGNWRMGIFDDRHFTIAHKDGKTSEILTSDGAVHASFPSSVFHTWNRPLGYPSGIAFGHEFIQMGNWRVAAMDDHLSISHKDGQTPKFYSSTGHITHGPTTAHNAWSRPIGPASGVTFGDRFIQIGKFRIGDADGLHLATTYLSGVPGGTPLFLHAHWGWCGTINKHVYGPTVNARHAHWHCGSLQANMGSCPGIVTGDDFMQIGQWRLAADGATFSVSHIDGQAKTFSAASLLQTNESLAEATASTTASLLQANDSLMVAGVWSRQPMAAASNKRVQFGDRVIQIGQWRLGDVDGNHFSISHSSLKTLVIYRSNSADDPHPVHEGARPEWGMWGGLASRNPPMDQSMGVSFGDRFIQIGNFRLGDVDGKHFSVAHAGTGKTLMVFQSDGHHGHHHCPRDDFTTLGRRMEQCQVMEP